MNKLFEQQFPQSHARDLYILSFAQKFCTFLASGIAIVILCGWLLPSVEARLPDGWWLMKQNNALSVLVGALSILLIQKEASITAIRTGGFIIVILALAALYGHVSEQTLTLETFLVPDHYAEFSGRMSLHSSIFFCLLGTSFIVEKKHQEHCNNLRDILTLFLIGMILVIFSGYFFSVTSLYGHSTEILVAPHEFICMCLLTFANFVRGVYGGIFSLFLGSGIGSYTARITLPWVLIGPFAVISAINYLSTILTISLEKQIALSATLISLMLFFIILWLSNRISYLEDDLRKLALTDEMTGLYNHRAFSILGEHAFQESLRNDSELVLLFFDLDGLKNINDTLGHKAGSEMIIEFSKLLKTNFRRNEAIARIGGDEFAVLSKQNEIDAAIKRLADAIDAANSRGHKPYRISYSHGKIIGKAKNYQSIDDLLQQADALMYKNKRKKKLNAYNV